MKSKLKKIPAIYKISLILVTLLSSISYAQPYKFGIFPYFDAAKLASLHKPLKDYLASSTDTNLRMISAPSFRLFKERTSKGYYDLLVTAPHLGRIAQKTAGYEWLGFTSNKSYAVFVSHVDSGIRTINDLKNKSIALPPKGAIIHHLALDTLSKNGLFVNKNIKISLKKSHNNALLSASMQDTDAAAFGAPTWKKYNAPDKNKLLLLSQSEDIPGFAIMVHPKLPKEIKEKLKNALFMFEQTELGRSYFEKTGLEGIREKTNEDISLLDKYLSRM